VNGENNALKRKTVALEASVVEKTIEVQEKSRKIRNLEDTVEQKEEEIKVATTHLRKAQEEVATVKLTAKT